MSTSEVQQPVHEVQCDGDGCPATFRASHPFDARSAHRTRLEAGKAGWDVPPPRGKGSRRKTDFCPQHTD